jgi:hypothetical protein
MAGYDRRHGRGCRVLPAAVEHGGMTWLGDALAVLIVSVLVVGAVLFAGLGVLLLRRLR